VNRTGIFLMPLTKSEWSREGSAVSSMSGSRSTTWRMVALISARARLAPRQKCTPPPPNVTWSFGVRAMSKVCGSLKKNSAKIDSIMGNADKALINADKVMVKADGVMVSVDRAMKGVENLTGTADTPGSIADTLASYKTLAEDLDKKTLKHFDVLIGDARRTLATIDTAVKNFDRNPQRVIFGAGSSSSTPAPAPAAPAGRPARAQQQ